MAIAYVYIPVEPGDAIPGVPARDLHDYEVAALPPSLKRQVTRPSFGIERIYVPVDQITETEQERLDRLAAEAAARAAEERLRKPIYGYQFYPWADAAPTAAELVQMRSDVAAVADVPAQVDALETTVAAKADASAVTALATRTPPTTTTDQAFVLYDSVAGGLGWFQGPVLVANWAPYKADGDDSTLVGAKLQTFLNAVSATKIPGVVLPGTYRSDARLDVGNDTTLYLHGVTLRDYNPLLGSGAEQQPMLRLRDVTNVVLAGGTLDGRKASHTGTTEYKYGVGIYGGSNITIREMVAVDNKGDGLGLEHSATTGAPTDVVIDHFISRRSHRNGGFLAAGDNVTIRDSVFEGAGGTSPQAGFDVESINPAKTVRHLRFVRCAFRDNASAGLTFVQPTATAAPDQEHFLIDACVAEGNGARGFNLNTAKYLTVRDCVATANGTDGFCIGEGSAQTVRLKGGESVGNTQWGVRIGPPASGPIRDLTIDGMTVMHNVRGIASTIGTDPAKGLHRFTVRNCTIGDPDATDTQDYGLRIYTDAAAATTSLTVDGNTFGNATVSKFSPGGDAATRIVRDNRGYATRGGGVASVANGGSIAHGLAVTPTKYGATATAANRRLAITSVNATNLVISLTDGSGAAITTAENVAWWAEV